MFLSKPKKNLSSTGLKSTNARVAIMDILQKEKKPLDVKSIVDLVHKQGYSTDQATVYRILDLFYKKGIIQRIEFGEGKYRYEKSEKHHHHLICTNCQKVEDVQGDFVSKLEDKIRKENEFLVTSHSLEFYGLCKDCASKQN